MQHNSHSGRNTSLRYWGCTELMDCSRRTRQYRFRGCWCHNATRQTLATKRLYAHVTAGDLKQSFNLVTTRYPACVFGSKRLAICATVELSYNVFKIKWFAHFCICTWHATWKRCRYTEKSCSHGTVANVIAALLSYQLPTMLAQFMTTQFPVILLNDLSVPFRNDVFRPRPLRQSALWHGMP